MYHTTHKTFKDTQMGNNSWKMLCTEKSISWSNNAACSTSGLVLFGKVRHLSSAQFREMLLHHNRAARRVSRKMATHNSNCWSSSVRSELGYGLLWVEPAYLGPTLEKVHLEHGTDGLNIEIKIEQTFYSSVSC